MAKKDEANPPTLEEQYKDYIFQSEGQVACIKVAGPDGDPVIIEFKDFDPETHAVYEGDKE